MSYWKKQGTKPTIRGKSTNKAFAK